MLNNRRRRGLMLILSSPSGAGKTTLSRRLLEEDQDIELSVSATTRAPRSNESDGVDYHFISDAAFDEKVKQDEFFEYAKVLGAHFYGTPKAPVQSALGKGRDVLFDIDWQGAQQFEQVAASDLVKVFILPPSMNELERRLRGRGQDSDEVVADRMARAQAEISHWGEYHYVIVNDDIEKSLADLRFILAAERQARKRQPWLGDFVRDLMHPS